jgi:hypothetical protein
MGKKITASVNTSILGTYEGEALDTNITNLNGLDITKEVMDTVKASEDYAVGSENGWFIGFLGHPEDPACQEFQNGCIVLTDMDVQDNGKVYAKFNLIDTPVGQVVKKFIDAGVKFGISIRGAGDIVGNEVDPETFMFRGFDLVAFPAYPESVPTFTAVAASTNLEDRKKYQAICAAVRANLDDITSSTAIEVLKSQFAPQSEEYKALEQRKNAIECADVMNIDAQKIEAMTDMYLEAQSRVAILESENQKLRMEKNAIMASCKRKVNALQRISDEQLGDALTSLDTITASRDSLRKTVKSLNEQLKHEKQNNLIYTQKITASREEAKRKDSTIADLKSKLRETVTASAKSRSQTSNLDSEKRKLNAELTACKETLLSYQKAYADIYANALGVHLDNISVTASTSVEDLESIIDGAINTASVPARADMLDGYITETDDSDDLLFV